MVTASGAMAASQAATYFTKDNYYIKDGITEVGKWAGKAAEILGLKGDVEQKQFVEILNGYKPGTLNDGQIKSLESLNERESALTAEAVKLSKMEDGAEKSALKADLDERIKSYNTQRDDFHKDVKTGGLHSELKALKEAGKEDPSTLKEIREMERELHGLLKNDFKIGDQVVPGDRENVGTITGFNKDGSAKVSFTNPETKQTAEKSFDLSDLTNISKVEDKGRENAAGGKNGQLIRDGLNAHGIASHRAGYDLTFSAPKSFSTMALVAGDTRLIDAHNEAMNKAMEYIEKEFAQTRTYDEQGNRQRENTENLAYAQFTHYTSRAAGKDATPDPQLHTHNLILNATEAGEKWMSLEPQQIFQAQKLAGQIYQNELARGAQQLGYGIEWNKSGGNYTAEIKGVDRELIDALSSRTAQINGIIAKEEERLGRSMTAEEKNNVTLSSRASKDEQDLDKLRETWDNTINDLGYTKDGLGQSTTNRQSDKTIAVGADAAVTMAVENLSAQKAVFSQHELTHEALKAAQGSASLEEIRAAINENTRDNAQSLEKQTNTFELGRDHNNSGARMFASGQMLTAEANIEKAVAEGKNTGAIMGKEEFAQAFEKIEAQKIAEAEGAGKEYFSLTEGQRAALEHIATSNDRYIGIQGDAGSGKTTALERMSKVASLLKETVGQNVELIGLAPTNVAAKNIEKDAGIASYTVDSFINKPVEPQEGKQQVYLVDESSMLDTVKMEKLVATAEKTGAKVVFIGDTKQLKSVGAGAMFERLQKTGQMEFAHVTEVMRQQTDMTKSVATAFKNAEKVGAGLNTLEAKGKLITAGKDGDMNSVRDQFVFNAVGDYIAGYNALSMDKSDREADLKNGLDSTIALVSTNADRHAFNEHIREKLVEAGVVSSEGHTTKTLEEKRMDATDAKFAGNYKVGDVLVAGNQKGRGKIQNGTKTTIAEVNRADNSMRIEWETKSGEKREKWIRADKAGKDFTAFTKSEKEFAAGDKIAFEKKDKSTGVDNGETGIIKAIGEDGKWTVDKGGSEITVDPAKYPYVSHGYAMTVHKAQGQSIDRVHIYADSSKGGLSLNAGYVQMTRAKYDVTVYADNRENLEKQYMKEQLKDNASDWLKTDQFADAKFDSASTAAPAEIAEARYTEQEADKAERLDKVEAAHAAVAKNEIKAIDSRISSMREEADGYREESQHHWKESKSITQTQQSRSQNMFYAARAGAMEKDLKSGMRYQQLLKTEAQIMVNGEIDLKGIRDFVGEKGGLDDPIQKEAFLSSQARQQEHLDKMVADKILIRDEKNPERYELAVSRGEFAEYREGEKAHESRTEIAEGSWNKALGDRLFSTAQAKTDATMIAGGTWNPREAVSRLKAEGLYSRDTKEVFERLEARYERLASEGLVTKGVGGYKAKDGVKLKEYVSSKDDKAMAFRGEGESVQQYREMKKMEKDTAIIPGAKRIDQFVGRATHVNAHVWVKDIQSSYKVTARMLNVNGFGGAAVAGVGVALGTAKTVGRGLVGLMYKATKAIVKETVNAVGATASSIVTGDAEREKIGEIIAGQKKSFEERLQDAATGKGEFSPSSADVLKDPLKKEDGTSSSKDDSNSKSFYDRLDEIMGKGKSEGEQANENQKSSKDKDEGDEKSTEDSNSGKEKEAEKAEERERD